MMSFHLVQILQQIQQTVVDSQRSMQITKQTSAAKERDRRILQLTIDEINGLDRDVKLYKGVGKMCVAVLQPVINIIRRMSHRFMMTPRQTMEKELKAQEKELTNDINVLAKKVRTICKLFEHMHADIFAGEIS